MNTQAGTLRVHDISTSQKHISRTSAQCVRSTWYEPASNKAVEEVVSNNMIICSFKNLIANGSRLPAAVIRMVEEHMEQVGWGHPVGNSSDDSSSSGDDAPLILRKNVGRSVGLSLDDSSSSDDD